MRDITVKAVTELSQVCKKKKDLDIGSSESMRDNCKYN